MTEAPLTPGTALEPSKAQAVNDLLPAREKGLTPLEEAQVARQVEQFMALVRKDDFGVNSPSLKALDLLGKTTIESTSALSSGLLSSSLGDQNAATAKEGVVAKNLNQLRSVMEELNPSKPRKFLGLVPWGKQALDYVKGFQSKKEQLDGVLASLEKASQDLALDNQELIVHGEQLRTASQAMKVANATADGLLEAAIAEVEALEATDPERAAAVKAHAVRKIALRRDALITHSLTMVNSYRAISLLVQNNSELQGSVEQARTTTAAALSSALALKAATARQKNVSKQVEATSSFTNALLEEVTKEVKDSSLAVLQQADSTLLSPESLRQAIENIEEAVSQADAYRQKVAESRIATYKAMLEAAEAPQRNAEAQGDEMAAHWLTVAKVPTLEEAAREAVEGEAL